MFGALIAGITERAERYATKDALVGASFGLSMNHLLRGVYKEMNEPLELATTPSPEDWAYTSELAPKVINMRPIGTMG